MTVRFVILLLGLPLLILSQWYWFTWSWRMAGRPKHAPVRWLFRLVCFAVWALLFAGMAFDFRGPAENRDLPWRNSRATALIALWFASGLFGYIGLKAVAL